MRDKLTISTISLLRALGWPFDNVTLGTFLDHAEAEGVVETESGDLVTPSGESLGAILGRLWTGPTTPATAPQDAPKPDQYHGYSQADWQSLRPELKYGAADTAPATPGWQKSVPVVNDQMCAAHARLSLADFQGLPLERRLEIEAVVKGSLISQQKAAQ